MTVAQASERAPASTPPHLGRVRGWRRPGRTPWIHWMVVPTLLILAFVIGYPVVRAIQLSFQTYHVLSGLPAKGVGLANYRLLFHDPEFWSSLRNTAIYTFGSVAVAGILGFLLALVTENFSGRLRHIRTVLLTPWAVPIIVVAFLFRYMFTQTTGVVNAILNGVGLIHGDIHWLASSTWALPTVMVANIWTAVPFFFLIFAAALTSVPGEIVEAARIDRASGWSMITKIKLPYLLGPGLIATLIMVINNFNDFAKVWAMTQGGPAYSTTTLVVYVYRLAFSTFDMGYAAAIGVVWLVLLLVFAAFYVRLIQRTAR